MRAVALILLFACVAIASAARPGFRTGCRVPVGSSGYPAGPRFAGPCGRCPEGVCPDPAEQGRAYIAARVARHVTPEELADTLAEAIGNGRVPPGGLGIRVGRPSPTARSAVSYIVSIPSELRDRAISIPVPGVSIEPLD